MKIVVDSNILFSAFISGKGAYLDIFRRNDIYMPDIVLFELNKQEARLIKKTNLEETDFRLFVHMLFEEVSIIPKFAISDENWRKAYKICKDVDEKDTSFVALSLELKIPLWTNDKALIKGLREKGFSNFITAEELFAAL